MRDSSEGRNVVPLTEGQVSKGGQNPPNPGSARPPAPQGSGGQSPQNQGGQLPQNQGGQSGGAATGDS